MGKLLLWAVIILAVLFVSRVLSHQKARARMAAERPGPNTAAGESMVRCAHCQIYLPRSEAYMSQGKTWCCAEHARLGLKS